MTREQYAKGWEIINQLNCIEQDIRFQEAKPFGMFYSDNDRHILEKVDAIVKEGNDLITAKLDLLRKELTAGLQKQFDEL